MFSFYVADPFQSPQQNVASEKVTTEILNLWIERRIKTSWKWRESGPLTLIVQPCTERLSAWQDHVRSSATGRLETWSKWTFRIQQQYQMSKQFFLFHNSSKIHNMWKLTFENYTTFGCCCLQVRLTLESLECTGIKWKIPILVGPRTGGC